jgi:uncharacterized Tic20 family protein
MPFTIACPNCDAKLKATDTLMGKTIKCPRCSKPVLVQQPSPSPVTAMPQMELPPSKPILEEPVGGTFVDDDEPAPSQHVRDRSEPVDELPEVDDEDDEEIEEAEFDEAMPADGDYDSRRRRQPQRRRIGGVTHEDCQTAMFIYLLGIFTHFIGPIILWMMKKDQSKFIDHHGKEVINFSITIAIAGLILSAVGVPVVVLTFCLGAFIVGPLGMALGIYATVMMVIGAMRASKGEWWEFPISFRMIK